MTTTTDLSKFGTRELIEVRDLLDAMLTQGLPTDFGNEGVHPMFNMNSGCVFLTNDDYDVCMLNGDKLESFYTSPYAGIEGFFDELVPQFEDMEEDDKEWLIDLAKILGRSDELPQEE